MSAARNLLFYQTDPQPLPLIDQLSAAGWAVHLADTVPDAVELLNHQEIKVGLFQLDGTADCTDTLNQLHPMNGTFRQHVEWVALLPIDSLAAEPLRKCIADYFYDYHTLPADRDRLLFSLGHAYGMADMVRALTQQHPTIDDEQEDEMVGTSTSMQALFQQIRKVASVDAPVLITGESGTGKELAASAIHERSSRHEAPFVAVNCGALPASLIQSELFGHEKGAFTGAHERKIGFIEAAQGGTLFLDEIGDLPHELQINLLRFLQEGTIERVGSREKLYVDARIVAATHVDIDLAVKEKRFREDLYYRLNVLSLQIPPLRERGDDVSILAKYFFKKFSTDGSNRIKGFSDAAIKAMKNHEWPGNVRELINRVRRAMVMSDKRFITPADLGLDGRNDPSVKLMTLDEARSDAEAEAIRKCLRRTDNNISQAARNLGISRVTLYRLMEKYEIRVT
ncbi:sigma-54 dependent transcriptional regulator [Acidihalobacter prosperus]|uniref:Sigma-54-dependent Fis family transcriptional regulator n=1 Tax=Acidihalobacter prosperus TaxID=160660 RepID=A0A1A6C815_9GAMM|nr:sigma-54 dependent transcriptional regulator [Acidihalobacter prosperus]OBS10708.1 sigma-54-dependent Fis family transcriptional regulator [Acidihalobacter prosperus]